MKDKHIKVYATYSHIFGYKYDKSELIEIINDLPLGTIFPIISQLLFSPKLANSQVIKDSFIKDLENIDSDKLFSIREKIGDSIIYTPQSLLTTWKWLLAYGNPDNLDKTVEPVQGLRNILFLNLAISDYLFPENETNETDIIYELLRNISFNSYEDIGSSIGRAYYIYCDIAIKKELFIENEYIDFNNDFIKKNGYSIELLLAILFGLYSSFIQESSITNNWRKDITVLFSKTSIPSNISEIINPLLLNYSDANLWAVKTIEYPWNYQCFKDKPFFQFEDKTIIPISGKMFTEQVFHELFYRVRNCYDEDDVRFISFFGRPFEIYIANLLENCAKMSSLKYEVIKEFRYGKDNSKKSPDAFLKLEKKLIVIEAKSQRIKADAIEINDNSLLEKEKQRLVLSPLKQMCNRLSEIMICECPIDLSSISEIYLIIINVSDFPTLPPIEKEFSEQLKEYSNLPIRGFIHLNIIEYEILCYLLSRKNGRPITRILENYIDTYEKTSFRNFLKDSSIPYKRPDIISRYLDRAYKRFNEILFPKK
ncbi:hypothetical protein LPY66_04185 [Dehalobacter sp. DCM]|uniref:hypothetical protein n=1 Tax=Dehalobacter sp. DCM TaxID=2907827 RepID=UPI003081A51F|nr:hypothetical protein LPY66_04185 [Dehalobacter sp. DCM]